MARIILIGPSQREFAKAQIDAAPDKAVVTIREKSRTDDQNRLMWPLLADIARADPIGLGYDDEEYKTIFMRELKLYQPKFLRGLDGDIFPVGARSSKLTVAQFADLITCIQEYGDRHGVVWTEPQGEVQ